MHRVDVGLGRLLCICKLKLRGRHLPVIHPFWRSLPACLRLQRPPLRTACLPAPRRLFAEAAARLPFDSLPAARHATGGKSMGVG